MASENEYDDICERLSSYAKRYYMIGLESEYFSETCSIPILPPPNLSSLQCPKTFPASPSFGYDRSFHRHHFEMFCLGLF